MPGHQYIERGTGKVVTEQLFGDPIVRWLYSSVREKAPFLFDALTSSRVSSALGLLNYHSWVGSKLSGNSRLMKECSIDLGECIDPPEFLDTPKKVFERKIRYWETRLMSELPELIVSPADSRVLVGSLCESSSFWIKNKFFEFEELIGTDKARWLETLDGGDFAVFRLTPDKYHYNHCPVSGEVLDFYELHGEYHSCNPGAVVLLVTPYSKNKRTVTIIDTDVPGGSYVGLVAMVEVVALMIGDILQCYSENKYDCPKEIEKAMFVKKGQPKSLFRPGSSTTVLLFQKGRIEFSPEILSNMRHPFAQSRFTHDFKTPLVETDVKVRSWIGVAFK